MANTARVFVRAFIWLAILASGLLTAASAQAAEPDPRLAFVEWLAEPPMTRLVSKAVDAPGRRALPLGGVQPTPFEGPAWTADGSALVFAGYPVDGKGEARDNARSRLFVVGAEGGTPRELPKTVGATRPVLSPDGQTVAFERIKIVNRYDPEHPLKSGLRIFSSAWTVSIEGRKLRRLIPGRPDLLVTPAAYSPDGSTLLLERSGRGGTPEVVALRPGKRSLRVIAREAEQPAFSPDGSRIALISYRDGLRAPGDDGPEPVGELYVVNADGSQPRRVTRSKEAQESQPSWSPDGARLAFLRARGPAGLGFGTTLVQANADGSCARRVTGSPGRRGPAIYGPAWRPGTGREAGPIIC